MTMSGERKTNMTMWVLWRVGRRRKIVWTYSVPVPALWRCLVPSWTIVDLAEGIAGEGRGKRNGQDIAEHVRQSVSGDRGERDCGMWTPSGFRGSARPNGVVAGTLGDRNRIRQVVTSARRGVWLQSVHRGYIPTSRVLCPPRAPLRSGLGSSPADTHAGRRSWRGGTVAAISDARPSNPSSAGARSLHSFGSLVVPCRLELPFVLTYRGAGWAQRQRSAV